MRGKQFLVFVECHFSDSSFEGADLRQASFLSCAMENVRFNFADLRGAKFIADFWNVKWNRKNVIFHGANIAGIQAEPTIQELMKAKGAVVIENDSEWGKFKREQHFDPELQEWRFLLRP